MPTSTLYLSRACLSLATGLAYLLPALVAYRRGLWFVAVAAALLTLGNLLFHSIRSAHGGLPAWPRQFDVAAMWMLSGALAGALVHPVATVLLGVGLAAYYLVVLNTALLGRVYDLWTSRDLPILLCLTIMGGLGHAIFEGTWLDGLYVLGAAALFGIGFLCRVDSERIYSEATNGMRGLPREVASHVPLGLDGVYADVFHALWHVLTAVAIALFIYSL